MEHVSLFSQETGFDISSKVYLMETICLFPGKNKKKYFNMSPAEILTRVQELRFKLIQLMYLSFNANVKSRDIAQYKGDKIDLNL